MRKASMLAWEEGLEASECKMWTRSKRSHRQTLVGGGLTRKKRGWHGTERSQRLVEDRNQTCLGSSTMPRTTIDQCCCCCWGKEVLKHRTKFRGHQDGKLESSKPRRTSDGHRPSSSLETNSNPYSLPV